MGVLTSEANDRLVAWRKGQKKARPLSPWEKREPVKICSGGTSEQVTHAGFGICPACEQKVMCAKTGDTYAHRIGLDEGAPRHWEGKQIA